MPKFISDADMEKMAAAHSETDQPAANKPKFISDGDLEKMQNDEHIKAHENDGFIDKIKDPKRWQAIANNTGPYAQEVVEGDAPMVIPGTAVPRLAMAAGKLASGAGPAWAAARTGLSTVQGALTNAYNEHKEGDSWKDTIDHATHGGKLSGTIQLAAESIPLVGKLFKAAGTKGASALSGEAEKVIKTYAGDTDDVNAMIKKSGGDMTTASDQVRTELTDGIQKTKKGLNSTISKALEGANPELRADESKIIQTLEDAKSKLNPNYKSQAIAEIDEMINTIKAEAKSGRAEGGLSAKGLYETKQFLNESAKTSYPKDGAIFNRSSEAARAAKAASGDARDLVRTHIPEVTEADQQLSKMHQIEGRMNKNLLAAGKPDGALFAAGEGNNPRNMATLRELERISGVPVTKKIEQLAAARAFANPSLLPTGSTGKVLARMAVGAGVGGYYDGKEGAMIGGALASPMAMKVGINAINLASKLTSSVPNFAKLTRENPVLAQAVVQALDHQIRKTNPDKPIPPEAQEFIRQNPKLLESTPVPVPSQDRKPSSELKGEAKWHQDGIDKLGLDQTTADQLLSTSAGKRLLLEAHSLPANSKRLQLIKTQIQGQGK